MKKILFLALWTVLLAGCLAETEDYGYRLSPIDSLQEGRVEFTCGEDKSNCVANLQLPEGFSYAGSQVFYYGDTVYTSFASATTEETCVFENGEQLFCDRMVPGSESKIVDVRYVLGAPVFTYTLSDGEDGLVYESFSAGVFFNDYYGVDSSYAPFEYEEHLGFMARLNGAVYLVYNDQLMETPFDSFRAYTCCAAFPDGFVLYVSGKLKLTASVDGEREEMVLDLTEEVPE